MQVRFVSAPPSFYAKINFQPSGAAVPPGYLVDAGQVFAARGNGLSCGWNANTTGEVRDRNVSNSPDPRYDTLIQLQKPTNPNASWEIAVPNGTYTVRLVASDPSIFGDVLRTNVEGA